MASASRRRSPRPSCAPSARGSGSTAATGSLTGKRSKYAVTRSAGPTARTCRPSPGTGKARLRSGPDGRGDGGHCALRGMRNPLSARRARGPRTVARRVGTVAQQRARHRPAATRAGTLVCPGQGPRHLQWLRRPHRRQPGRPDHTGLPVPLELRPGPHGRVLPTMQDSARTATLPTAPSTGTCPDPGTVTARAATARAWTRTGLR